MDSIPRRLKLSNNRTKTAPRLLREHTRVDDGGSAVLEQHPRALAGGCARGDHVVEQQKSRSRRRHVRNPSENVPDAACHRAGSERRRCIVVARARVRSGGTGSPHETLRRRTGARRDTPPLGDASAARARSRRATAPARLRRGRARRAEQEPCQQTTEQRDGTNAPAILRRDDERSSAAVVVSDHDERAAEPKPPAPAFHARTTTVPTPLRALRTCITRDRVETSTSTSTGAASRSIPAALRTRASIASHTEPQGNWKRKNVQMST